jgi:hypothetical protein
MEKQDAAPSAGDRGSAGTDEGGTICHEADLAAPGDAGCPVTARAPARTPPRMRAGRLGNSLRGDGHYLFDE